MTLRGALLAGNAAVCGSGGAVAAWGSMAAAVSAARFTTNAAGRSGGTAIIGTGSDVSVEDTALLRSSAGRASAMLLLTAASAGAPSAAAVAPASGPSAGEAAAVAAAVAAASAAAGWSADTSLLSALQASLLEASLAEAPALVGTFTSCATGPVEGGALWVAPGATARVRRAVIAESASEGMGGAFHVNENARLDVSDTSVLGSSCDAAGGASDDLASTRPALRLTNAG